MSTLREEHPTPAAAGPAASTVWEARAGSSGDLLVTPDAADPATTWFLPGAHGLPRGADGYPALQLTLLLLGLPGLDETDVTARVRQATLAFTVELTASPPAAEAGVSGGPAERLVPLYPRAITVELVAVDGSVTASGAGVGDPAWVPLRATLDEQDALAVLSALEGTGDRLALRSTLRYRTAPESFSSRLRGSWAAVHDLLPRGVPVDLREVYSHALRTGALAAQPVSGSDLLFASFAASARAVLVDPTGMPAGRPSPLFTVDLAYAGTGLAGEGSVTITDPLRDVFGGVLSNLDRGRVISLLAIHADARAAAAGTTAAAAVGSPRRIRSEPTRRGVGDRSSLTLALLPDDRISSTSQVLAGPRPGRGGIFLHLSAANTRPIGGGVLAASLNDQNDGDGAASSLPIVDDEASWVFPAFRTPGLSWYVPTFEVVEPSASDDAATSPFLFSFTRAGATAEGDPALDATVTLQLRQFKGPEVTAAGGGTSPQPIPTDSLEVVLDLPFRDAQGHNQRQRFSASSTREGDVVTVTVPLIDDWARLAYGALSQPGFQTEPARIGIAWSFQGWHHTGIEDDALVWGGKSALLPIRYESPPVENLHAQDPLVDPRPAYLDATSATYHSPVGALQFQTERSTSPARLPTNARPLVVVQAELSRPELLQVGNKTGGLLAPSRDGSGPRGRPLRWLRQTHLRSQDLDVLYPCAQLGSRYVEQRPEGPVAVGCQDALRLGQTTWRQYEEVLDLADPSYRVFRSLQQPGRFLLLPTMLVTARHPTGTPGRAYHPMILLYALLDPAKPANNQVVVQATLAPDVTAAARATLLRRLAAYAPRPSVALAGDVECTPTFDWTIVGLPTVNIRATLAPGGVAVALSSDLAHALLLRDLLAHDGIAGSLTLQLPDGSTMRSGLALGLASMTGPAETGPVEVTVADAAATLVNRIERPVSVNDLRVDSGGPSLVDLPVERLLAPGESVRVDLGSVAPEGPDGCWPVYTVPAAPPAVLEEVRSYVEDITMNVVFMDLTDHAIHQVTRLDVKAQLAGASGLQDVPMLGTPASGTAEFVLPLTTYLTQRVVRYQITVSRTDGTSAVGTWLDWDVATAGCLVSLTWSALGLPETIEEQR